MVMVTAVEMQTMMMMMKMMITMIVMMTILILMGMAMTMTTMTTTIASCVTPCADSPRKQHGTHQHHPANGNKFVKDMV